MRGGWRVVASHRTSSDTRRLRALGGVELVQGTLDDASSLERAMPEGADAVFHVAGNASMWRGGDAAQRRDNVDATAHVVAAALTRRAARFVQTVTKTAPTVTPEMAEARSRRAEFSSEKAVRVLGYRTKSLVEMVRETSPMDARGRAARVIVGARFVGRNAGEAKARLFAAVANGAMFGACPMRRR